MSSAAQAPSLGQMSQLNENISLLLSSCEEESEEDGETASVEDSGRVDMEAGLTAILDNCIAGTAATRTGDATLQELGQDLLVKEQTS